MKKVILFAVAVALFLIAAPTFAQQPCPPPAGDSVLSNGTFSVGVGGGFQAGTSQGAGHDTVAPIIVSAKYWDPNWELGAEAFTVFKKNSTTDDQLGQAWVAYRYDLNYGEGSFNGYTYVGVGVGGIFKANNFGNSVGPVILVGYDADEWGVEAKGAWYDPTLVSVVAYYNFDSSY
jgi:hypothetical protein